MTCACQIWSRGLLARLAAGVALMCDQIGRVSKRMPECSHAFDMLAGDGDDMRQLPLSMRKANLARLLARRSEASSLPRSNKARLARTCFGRPATWGWKVWYRSAETGPIVPARRPIGSR